MKIIRRLLNKKDIVKINLTKTVNNITFDNLYLALKEVNSKDHCCVFLSLNTGCSMHQAIVMSNIIHEYREKKDSVSVYTFAGDSCMGPALLTLLSGDKFISDENTLFGFYDFTLQKTNFANFVDERNIKVKINTEGTNKLRLNPFKSYDNKDIDWALDLLKERRSIFLDELVRIRLYKNKNVSYLDKSGKLITLNEGNKEEVKLWRNNLDENLGSTFILSSQMKSMGLLDAVASTEAIKYSEFPKSKVKVSKPRFSFEAGDHLGGSIKDILSRVEAGLGMNEFYKFANLYKLAELKDLSLSNDLKLCTMEGINPFEFDKSHINFDSDNEYKFLNHLTSIIAKYQI